MSLNASQSLALRVIQTFLAKNTSQCFCLNAPSGYGKSYLINSLMGSLDDFLKRLKIIGVERSIDIDQSATTNKAATQLTNGKTIHKLFGFYPLNNGKLSERKARKVYNKVLIIDEASYVSKELYDLILKWTVNCQIIFIGDMYQLKSVGCKFSVFEQGFPDATLTIPQRQDPDSGLFALCCHLRQCVIDQVLPNWDLFRGLPDVVFHDDRSYVNEVTNSFRDEQDVRLLAYYNTTVDTYSGAIMDIQGRTSMYEVGNILVSRGYTQGLLYSEQEVVVHSVERASDPGGPAIIINGRYIVALGNWIKPIMDRAVRDKDWDTYYHYKHNFCAFSLGHSLTTYKSQGSTYDKTILDVRDIMGCHDLDTKLRQLYVGVSRARKEVHLYI